MSNSADQNIDEPVDERVQEVLEDGNLSDTELLEELENDDDDSVIANIREKRMEQLKQEMAKLQEMRQHNHGTYEEIPNEKDILKITTSTKLCVVHFFHKEFRRCQIIDKHLAPISQKHFKTRFVKINVENAPFLVEKLKVQVLPCVISFIDGISVDRIVGFEELGNTDSFTTAALELRLSKSDRLRCFPIEKIQLQSS
ncbi:3840_t:CDS:2 [Paraglomus occultum]|uniref:3840_t:CDS:1 n=1 Tax=Paraglomus occultum TaxID=144539 RepID=A0A9N9F910_9GLOM|nr:3840_t:CDS:2 [Paraglomus occultum]